MNSHLRMPWLLPFAKAAGDEPEMERIKNLTEKLGRTISRAFLDAIAALSGQIDLKMLADLLAQNRVSEALALINAQMVATGLQPIAGAITAATVDAGRAAVEAMKLVPSLSGMQVHFGITNPETISHLQRYEMGAIRELTVQALASVRVAITDGVQSGRNPNDVARDVRAFIGLTERQTRAVVNYRRLLESGDAEALQRALRDRRFDASVARAIQGGAALKPEQIEKMVARYRDRYLKYRSETIARTEAIRAVSTGNVMAWKQAVADGKIDADTVTKQWVYTHDARTRDAHRNIPGLNPNGVGLDEPFKSDLGPIRYPGDPEATAGSVINCRCALIIRYRPPKVTDQPSR